MRTTAKWSTLKQHFHPLPRRTQLSLWKKYMENLEARPYTKLTTRETIQLENNDVLGRNLHAIDGAIYGHDTSVIESLENLKQFCRPAFF